MKLATILERNRDRFGLVLPLDYRNLNHYAFDLTGQNPELTLELTEDPAAFEALTIKKLQEHNAEFGMGKYNENRMIYDHSDLFSGEDRRTIHLGIDLWVRAGTEVFAPLDAKVHSFNNNEADGDYGPTIILSHELEGIEFYTLYGHLSLDSLDGLEKGKEFKKGDVIGRIGNYPVNGNWPSHLHFQVIGDMMGKEGDFPGVTSEKERERFLDICPDPNLILQIPV